MKFILHAFSFSTCRRYRAPLAFASIQASIYAYCCTAVSTQEPRNSYNLNLCARVEVYFGILFILNGKASSGKNRRKPQTVPPSVSAGFSSKRQSSTTRIEA